MELELELPIITRARGWRLYTADNKRLVDLWQNGGRAILGHKGEGILKAIKNEAERGLTTAFPNPWQARLEKALIKLFVKEGYSSCFPPPLAGGAGGGVAYNINSENIFLWRPFLPDEDKTWTKTIKPLLPLSWPFEYEIEIEIEADAKPETTPPAPPRLRVSPLSAITAAALSRAVYNLLASPETPDSRLTPKLKEALEAAPACSTWERHGPYLYYKGGNYEADYQRFLERGFLLPPNQRDPAILPGELSPGEEAGLCALFK
ncbi:MAG: hypothetical protein LBM77_14370 [Spirochaetaceae bacterium]|jgi:hypothetical protein|nr:hypothetical protein [Spirochaetaceae bacterium]